MNKETASGGMGVKAAGPAYEITPVNGTDGAFYDPYHKVIQESETDSYAVWKITEDDNFGNYSGSTGIRPGSHGKISFYVTPKVSSIDLDFCFEAIGYRNRDITSVDPDTGETVVTGHEMIPITSSSEDETDRAVSNYLNGHILLFEKGDKVGDDIIYSGLIASNEDMKRVIKGRRFDMQEENNAQLVTVYWVWPETLSKLVDARSNSRVDNSPFTDENDDKNTRQAIMTNIADYPQYYLKSVSLEKTTGDNDEEIRTYTVKDATLDTDLDSAEIVGRYNIYSDLYDQVDNNIGMTVNYILLRLSVTESTSAGGE